MGQKLLVGYWKVPSCGTREGSLGREGKLKHSASSMLPQCLVCQHQSWIDSLMSRCTSAHVRTHTLWQELAESHATSAQPIRPQLTWASSADQAQARPG
eukprot:1160095-Pelagomonas_calceolata.AAC.6